MGLNPHIKIFVRRTSGASQRHTGRCLAASMVKQYWGWAVETVTVWPRDYEHGLGR